jgi:hypothetical protein
MWWASAGFGRTSLCAHCMTWPGFNFTPRDLIDIFYKHRREHGLYPSARSRAAFSGCVTSWNLIQTLFEIAF